MYPCMNTDINEIDVYYHTKYFVQFIHFEND
jgi:hypothetical protein